MAFGWIKKIVTTPVKVVKSAAVLAKSAVKLVKPKGANIMNDSVKIEKAIREIVEAIIASRKKSGLELAVALVPMMIDIKSIMDSIKDIPEAEWVPNLRTALDNLIGEEENALIGPHEAALVKVDIPYVGLEEVSDLILRTAEKAILAKAAAKAAGNLS